jgi:hypothetical protein
LVKPVHLVARFSVPSCTLLNVRSQS